MKFVIDSNQSPTEKKICRCHSKLE